MSGIWEHIGGGSGRHLDDPRPRTIAPDGRIVLSATQVVLVEAARAAFAAANDAEEASWQAWEAATKGLSARAAARVARDTVGPQVALDAALAASAVAQAAGVPPGLCNQRPGDPTYRAE